MVEKERLLRVPIFAGLDDAILQGLGECMELQSFSDGDTIFKEAEQGDRLYIVDEGQVVVSKVIDWEDMREKTLATLPEGAFFGEMALLDDVPRSATVRASGSCSMLSLSRKNFLVLLQRSSMVAAKLLFGIIKTVSARLRGTSIELVALYDTGKIVGEVRDLPTLTEKIVERLTETLKAPIAAFLLENPYSGSIEVVDAKGYPADLVPDTLVFDRQKEGFIRQLFVDRKPILARDAASLGWAPTPLEALPYVASPLVTNDAVVGAILIGGKSEGFTPDALNLLAGVASQVATAVENARMREEEVAKEVHNRHYVTY